MHEVLLRRMFWKRQQLQNLGRMHERVQQEAQHLAENHRSRLWLAHGHGTVQIGGSAMVFQRGIGLMWRVCLGRMWRQRQQLCFRIEMSEPMQVGSGRRAEIVYYVTAPKLLRYAVTNRWLPSHVWTLLLQPRIWKVRDVYLGRMRGKRQQLQNRGRLQQRMQGLGKRGALIHV